MPCFPSSNAPRGSPAPVGTLLGMDTSPLSIRERVARSSYDAVVVGSGPNGLAAAIVLARRGLATLMVEAAPTPGGGCRSAPLTLPGFTHDVCAAVHPLGFGSPIYRTFPLDKYGLEWVQPPAPLAHPFDDGTAAMLERDVSATGATLGPDADNYVKLMQPLVPDWEKLCAALRRPWRMARYPLGLARFGLAAIHSARGLSDDAFQGGRGPCLRACPRIRFYRWNSRPRRLSAWRWLWRGMRSAGPLRAAGRRVLSALCARISATWAAR